MQSTLFDIVTNVVTFAKELTVDREYGNILLHLLQTDFSPQANAESLIMKL